jgi:hypothetical protein
LQVQSSCERQQPLSQALEHLRSALELLDEGGAPAHIGAHVDLAANQLELTIAEMSVRSKESQIETNADPQ